MACCCKPGARSNKASESCLGRCDLPKHRCLDKEDVKPGPVPKHMGWLYTAKDAPEHQLRCGWRPGHISCQVLKRIEQHNCMKAGECAPCASACSRPPCSKPCCMPPKCVAICPSTSSGCKPNQPCGQPLIRIIRHAGQYSICTKPSNISNAPSGPYPLKYVLNTDPDDEQTTNAKYSVEAKFNDYHFDYTSSQSSFVLDFSPPEQRCYKPCPKKSVVCMVCAVDNTWPCAKKTKPEKKPKCKKKSAPNVCCKPNPYYKPKPCYRPKPSCIPEPCYEILSCYNMLPCIKPDPCRKPVLYYKLDSSYNPKPCHIPKLCYKRKPCYKPEPCCKPDSCCKTDMCKSELCCESQEPCYKDSCCRPEMCFKPCSTESTACTVCSVENLCPVKEKKKQKKKVPKLSRKCKQEICGCKHSNT